MTTTTLNDMISIAARMGASDGADQATDADTTITGDEGVNELLPNGARDIVGDAADALTDAQRAEIEVAFVAAYHAAAK